MKQITCEEALAALRECLENFVLNIPGNVDSSPFRLTPGQMAFDLRVIRERSLAVLEATKDAAKHE